MALEHTLKRQSHVVRGRARHAAKGLRKVERRTDHMIGDLKGAARHNAWAFAVGGLVAGIAAARVLRPSPRDGRRTDTYNCRYAEFGDGEHVS